MLLKVSLWKGDDDVLDLLTKLPKLKGLADLKRLSLARNKVTDAGLAHLKGMTGMEWLFLAEKTESERGGTGAVLFPN